MIGYFRTPGTTHTAVLAIAGLGLLAVPSACGSDVTEGGTGDTTTSTSSSGGYVDPDCYQDCLAKGGTEADCADRCWKDDGTGGGSSSSTSSSTSSGTGGTDGLNKETERDYYECMAKAEKYDGACTAEWKACNDSLACHMLLLCPYECYGDPDCIDQCHEIIPTGVELVTALIQCMVCDDGPCAGDCQNTTWQQYCH